MVHIIVSTDIKCTNIKRGWQPQACRYYRLFGFSFQYSRTLPLSWLVFMMNTRCVVYNFTSLEHDHSHGNENHDLEPTIQEKGLANPSALRRKETQGEYDSKASSPLYGHPTATRLGVVQEASELERNRTQSRTLTSSSTISYSSFRTALSRPFVEYPQRIYTEREPEIQAGFPRIAPQFKAEGPQNIALPPLPPAHQTNNPNVPEPPSNKKAGSMNMRALLLHVLGDAIGNIGVIATGLIMWLTDLSWKDYFDPIISIVLTCIIFSSALPLSKHLLKFYRAPLK